MSRLFNLCTDFLVFLTRVFHTSYRRISVWVNIYIQGMVLFFAAATYCVVTLVKHGISDLSMFSWIWLLMAVLQMVVVIWACWRYRPPLEKAFDMCYLDLERLSSRIRVPYTWLNIIIFIVIYLILLFLDIFLLK